MYKYLMILFIIVVSNIYAASTNLNEQTANKSLEGYYNSQKKSIRIPANERLTMNTVLCGLHLNISEEDNLWCSQKIVEMLEAKSTAFSEGKNSHVLYWALPQMCMILATPEINENITPEAREALKEVIWDYVSSHDDISKSQSLLNVYVSDNHDTHTKGVFLLASQILKDDANYKNLKYPDNTTLQQHYDAYNDFFIRYFPYRAKNGLTIEFSSSVYTGVYLQPIFVLYSCAEDLRLREYAGKYLDLFFADAAQETLNGIRGGAKVRMYKQPSTYSAENDKHMFCNYMLTGEPEKLPAPLSFDSIVIPVSGYKLPRLVYEMMTKPQERGSYSYVSRRLGQGDHILYSENKYNNAPMYVIENPSAVYRYSWCTPEYILGWFAVDESKHYMLINSQNQWMGLTTSQHLDSRVVFQTTAKDVMSRSVSYRDLMAVGDKKAVLIRRQLASYGDEFLMTYVSDDFSLEQDTDTGWIFGRNDKAFYALKPAVRDQSQSGGIDVSDNAKYEIVKLDNYDGRFIRYFHPSVIVAFETALSSEYDNFDAFKADIKSTKMQYINNFDEFEYYPSRKAAKLTMFVDMRVPKIDGKPINFEANLIYNSPYIQYHQGAKDIKIKGLNGEKMTINFD